MNAIVIEHKTETRNIVFQNGHIRLINRTPVLMPERKKKRRNEIESRLYDVFKKYRHSGR